MIHEDHVLKLLSPGGIISQTIKGYEVRDQQLKMACDVSRAYNTNKIALIEAGTGTGKSVAYLIPALLWAANNQERTVISTHTITLQEQLLFKDIPFLIKTLGLDLKATLVKGMNNYVCLRKLEDALQEKPLLPEFSEELDKIAHWKEVTLDGSKSDLPFMPTAETWDLVGAEGDACSHIECPHYKNCFFFKARREASDAHILIVNHHLLCADLASKKESANPSATGILPPYSRLVLDEAHHLEDVATEYFASRVSRFDLIRLFAKLVSEKKTQERPGKLAALRQKILEQFISSSDESIASILNRLEIDLAGEKQQILHLIQDVFQIVIHFFNHLNIKEEKEDDPQEKKWRLRSEYLKIPLWNEEVLPKIHELITNMRRYVHSLQAIELDIAALKNEKLNDKTKSVRLDILAIASRLEKVVITLEGFITDDVAQRSVKWMESYRMKNFMNMHLTSANLDISTILEEYLFKEFSTVIMCSATLATNRQFDFIRKRLGLNQSYQNVIERIYDSPFDYEKQALLIVPTDMPSPTDPKFIQRACSEIESAVIACKGQAFVLFTSFQMMRACYNQLKERLEKLRFPAFVQGEAQRKSLLNQFKKTPFSVLFGTDSFWEGVDVAGDALRCVIIVKLPFKVPSEPIIQARNEAITMQGGDPFLEYTVPNAIVKFKQGFGRLIRNRNDRGCIVCLDPRLINRPYGKLFLASLPKCTTLFEQGSAIQEKMQEFYKKTYYLTKKLEF